MHPTPPELSSLLGAADGAAFEAAWSRFVDAHTPLILSVARSLGGDRDAVMDRYAHVLEGLRRDDCARLRRFVADGRSRFTTWLAVVSRRLCLDHHRGRYGRKRGGGSGADGGTAADENRWALRRRLADLAAEGADVAETVAAPGADPERATRRRQRDRALEAALATLAPRDRLMLVLRVQDGLPASRVATILGLPTPFHVYRQVDRLLRRLRAELEGAGVTESSA